VARAKLVVLADEVVADLNKQPFEQTFKAATREYIPKQTLEETGVLKVGVTMAGTEFNWSTRNETFYDHSIDIGVQYRAIPEQGDAKERFDECMRLLEEIADRYRFAARTRLTVSDMPLVTVAFAGPDGAPYFPSHIHEFNQFTGVVRLTFREWRT
jgi:hypothetical protein